MPTEILVVGALVLSGSSVVAWIKFWMDQGAVKQNATNALAMATSALGQTASLKDDLSQFKVQVAHESLQYLREGDLNEMERRITQTLAEVKGDIRGMSSRLDRVLEQRT